MTAAAILEHEAAQSEEWHQRRLFQEVGAELELAIIRGHPHRELALRYVHHVSNGEGRNRGTGGVLRAMGVRSGIPDVCLAAPSRGFVGLAIELKKADGSADRDQVAALLWYADAGNLAVLSRGWRGAFDFLDWYTDEDALELGFEDVNHYPARLGPPVACGFKRCPKWARSSADVAPAWGVEPKAGRAAGR